MNLNEWKKDFFKYYNLSFRKLIGIEVNETYFRVIQETLGLMDKASYAFLVTRKASTICGPAIINLAGTLSREQEEYLLNSCEIVLTTDKGLAAHLMLNDRKVLFLSNETRHDAFSLVDRIRSITEFGKYKAPILPIGSIDEYSFSNGVSDNPDILEIKSAKIGIVMPLYNHEKYVKVALQSILDQTFTDWKLYIVDDGSTDNSMQVVREFIDERIVYVSHKKNKGISAALNTGFALTKEPYLTWVSSDNIYEDDFLKSLLEVMRNSYTIDFVYSNYKMMDENGKLIREVVNPPYSKMELKVSYKMGICFLFKSILKRKAGEFRDGMAQDWDMAIRMSQYGNFVHIDNFLGNFRQHKQQLSANPQSQMDSDKLKDSLKVTTEGKIEIVEEGKASPKIDVVVVETKKITPKIEKEKPSSEWELTKIPKIAHFYWGEYTLPFLRYLTVYTFCKFNPTWEVRFYYPKYKGKGITWKTGEQSFDINAKDYYKKLKKLPIKFVEINFEDIGINNRLPEVHKSDYLRWYLLSKEGGLWSDMDIVYFKSMNNLSINIKSNKDLAGSISYETPPVWSKHFIGFLLSAPNNEYYTCIWKKAKESYEPKDYQSIGVNILNKFSPSDINKKYPLLKLLNIPIEEMYFYCAHDLEKIYDKDMTDFNAIVNKGIALHWYGGCEQAASFVNKVTENNYGSFDIVLAKIIEYSMDNVLISNKLKVSIIIPTFNRPHLLRYCLLSLSKQSMPFETEIIVLNDYIPDETEGICSEFKDLKIKYIYTGYRNASGEIKWRIPGFAFNIGVKWASGDIIILACPEIYQLAKSNLVSLISPLVSDKKTIAYPAVVKDDKYGECLEFLEKHNGDLSGFKGINKLNELQADLPFLLAMWKEKYIEIGGYDEDFTGVCWDDQDIIGRLKTNGNTFIQTDAEVLHLYHKRHDYKSDKIKERWNYNKNLYEERKGMVVRNQDKIWGDFSLEIGESCKDMVSIIMTTFNRGLLLKNSLKTIVSQKKPEKVEIVIVDDGSKDETKEIVEKYQKDYPEWNIKYIYNHKFESFSNPAVALNIALCYAKGDIIIQSGADLLHIGEVIDTLLRAFKNEETYYAARLLRLPMKYVDGLPMDNINKLQSYLKGKTTEQPIMPIVTDLDKENALPFCAIYRKEWAYKIGMFDEEYLPGGAEDRDFVYRMQEVTPTRWCHKAWICHQDHIKFSGEEKFEYGYDKNYLRSFNVAEGRENRWRKKILFIGHFNVFPFPGFLWDSMKQSFMRLGHYCKFYDPFPISHSDKDLKNNVKMLSVWGKPETLKSIQKIVDDWQPDIIFSGVQNTWKLVSQLKTDALKVSWYGDMHKPETLEKYNGTLDCLFITNEGQTEDYERILGCKVFPVAFGILPSAHYRRNVEQTVDIGFVGKNHKRFASLKGYDNRMSLLSEIETSFDLQMLEDSWLETWDFFSKCKIVLSDSFDMSSYTQGYTSNRFFNIMGCGAFCLVRNFPGLEFWGEAGKHFVSFESNEEALEKIKYYLDNYEARKKIADAGYAWFHSYHSWIQRAKYMAGVIKNLLENRNLTLEVN